MALAKTTYSLLKKAGVVGYSKKNILGLCPLVISTAFVLLTEVLAHHSRKAAHRYFNDGLPKQLLLEFIATAEMCAVSFELSIIADNYGVWMYALYLFAMTIWWSQVWEQATACPYIPLEEMAEGKEVLKRAAMIVLSQVLGGIVVFCYVQTLWSMELAETHRGKAEEECKADLHVPILVGAITEGGGTCFARLVSRFLSDTQARFAPIVDSFFGTMMVVAAFNYTGGYLNPALATSLKFNCEGNDIIEFTMVYWLGACAGALTSTVIYNSNLVQNILFRMKTKQD